MCTVLDKRCRLGLCVLLMVAGLVLFTQQYGIAVEPEEDEFTTEFDLTSCRFKTIGANPYFILIPGYQLVLEGEEDDEEIHLEITVLRDTEKIYLEGIGRIKTRVVEEREWIDDELVEVSRNFFAICRKTNDVYYFGEDVDIYEDGEIVSHEGSWRAGEDDAMPGIIMPGTFLLGSRYYQEVAPDVAMDRAEHMAMGAHQLNIESSLTQIPGKSRSVKTRPTGFEPVTYGLENRTGVT